MMQGLKCKFCQLYIYPSKGEKLTTYDGHDYHTKCFDRWIWKQVERLERKLKTRGLTEVEMDELNEYRSIQSGVG